MPVNISNQEFTSVIRLSARERYNYFINKTADWEEVWSIKDDDGWGLMKDDDGFELVPVWPAEKYAISFCCGDWNNYNAEKVLMNNWLDRWIPGIERDHRKCAVFPIPPDKGIVVIPAQLKLDMEAALSQFD